MYKSNVSCWINRFSPRKVSKGFPFKKPYSKELSNTSLIISRKDYPLDYKRPNAL